MSALEQKMDDIGKALREERRQTVNLRKRLDTVIELVVDLKK